MAELLERTAAAVEPVGSTDDIRARLDAKTKPRGSLGRLEDLAVRATAAGARADTWRPAIVVAAADHGVARQGVSAYPQEVTRQMLATFAAGGAAVCVLARQAGAELVVVDAGVVEPLDEPGIRDLRLGAGTADFTAEPAMPREVAEAALEAGIGLAAELDASPLALGDMGIANTTAAAAVTAALLGAEPAEVCGRGTGIDGDAAPAEGRRRPARARAAPPRPGRPGRRAGGGGRLRDRRARRRGARGGCAAACRW